MRCSQVVVGRWLEAVVVGLRDGGDDQCELGWCGHMCVRTFRGGLGKKEQRFTAVATVQLIRERVSEIGEKLGYKVEKDKSGILGLMKEKTYLLAKILEVTLEL
ncbi:hypothetical protein LguiB_008760 [Lonicera macranthoides]